MTLTVQEKTSLSGTPIRDDHARGNVLSPRQKLQLALGIEAVGVDVIETGLVDVLMLCPAVREQERT